jgi:hypothetical protein
MVSLGHSFLAVFGECQLVAENLHAAEWVSRAMIKAVD